MYRLNILKRDYSEYEFIKEEEKVELSVDPIKEKLFHEDTFDIINDIIDRKESILRKCKKIQGVLVLKNNKTYGSFSKKLLYKCIPNNSSYPCFLIPYFPKLNFQKSFSNLFINFEFKEWKGQHPIGTIVDLIGSVDDNNSLYEYELYCKGLNTSLNLFTKTIIPLIPLTETKENTGPFIFSIDPINSKDFDDAFSIHENKISIYISNVSFFIEKMGSKAWNIFTNQDRISTIYLPDSKKSLLPTILSDDLCSLKEKCWRDTLVMEIENNNINFYIQNVYISKNFVYEEKDLLENKNYQKLFQKSKKLLSNYPYVNNIQDSHELVSYFMIMMNHQIGLRLSSGIYRMTEQIEKEQIEKEQIEKEQIEKEQIEKEQIEKEQMKILLYDYVGLYTNKKEIAHHKMLNLQSYIHITSPIRRLVDIVNMILFQQEMKLFVYSKSAIQFVNKWINQINIINEKNKIIKRVQNKCNMIHNLFNLTEVEGIVIDHQEIFIPSIKCFYSYFENLELYKKYNFKIILFEDEDKLKKRIRLICI
jgi:exoribonuclease R